MRTPQADGPLTQARLRLKTASRERALQAQQESQPSVTAMVARIVLNPPLLSPGVTSDRSVEAPARPIPLGWCQCGCGIETRRALKTRRELGWIKGQPLRYIAGHNDATGRGIYSLRPETVREAQRLREDQEAKVAAVAAAKAITKPASPNQPAPFVGPVGAPSPLMSYSGGVGIRGVRFVEPWVETQGRASLRPTHREKKRYQGHGYGSPARVAYRP
jgi:hypothetical protein